MSKKAKADWYCPTCEAYLVSERVTHEETCDTCGDDCEVHEVITCGCCKNEFYENESVPDDYSGYKGFAEEYFCPHCNARIE